MSQLIDFYSGIGTDHRGRTLDEILAWSDDRLEQSHDFIQWLFPLTEPSRFNPDAPLLSDSDVGEFELRPELRANMLRAMRRMMNFYEFSIDVLPGDEDAPVAILPRPDKSRHWLTPGDHNYLRITRILTSLGLVGLKPWAEAFFEGLAQLYRDQPSVIGPETFGFWQRAVRR